MIVLAFTETLRPRRSLYFYNVTSNECIAGNGDTINKWYKWVHKRLMYVCMYVFIKDS